MRRVFAVTCAALLSTCTSAAERAADSLELPDAVRAVLTKALETSREVPPLPVRSLRFATSHGFDSIKTYERVESGLLGIFELIPSRNGASRRLTYHGLLDLTTAMDTELGGVTAVPLGQLFMAFALPKRKAGVTMTTTGLAGDLVAASRPQPGSRFTYEHATDHRLTITGLFGRTNQMSHHATVTCSVAEARAAATLHHDLKGDYLPVSCEGKNRDGSGFQREFAYLADSRLYVLLRQVSRIGEEVYTISAVEYATAPLTPAPGSPARAAPADGSSGSDPARAP